MANDTVEDRIARSRALLEALSTAAAPYADDPAVLLVGMVQLLANVACGLERAMGYSAETIVRDVAKDAAELFVPEMRAAYAAHDAAKAGGAS
jgi:hypothetical protein